jgi:hypothetical protein
MNKDKLPMNYKRATTVSLEPSLSAKELALALLDPSEFATCEREREEIIVKGHAFPAESPEINKDILSVIKPECLENGDVTLRDAHTFSFARATSYIQRKFGLSGFKITGNRNRVVAIEVSSYVSYVEPEVHVKRYANILRAIKARYPHVHFPHPDCQTTTGCDAKLEALLKDLFPERDLDKIRKDAKDLLDHE